MDPLGAVFDEDGQNLQMGAVGRGAVNDITNADFTDVGTLFEIARSESIFADFVESVTLALPGAKKAREVRGNGVVQDLFTFVDIRAMNDVIIGDRLDNGCNVRLSVRQLDSEARTHTVALVFTRQRDVRGQLKENEKKQCPGEDDEASDGYKDQARRWYLNQGRLNPGCPRDFLRVALLR